MNYVFFDTETTGTDTTFDQILQFAAILTDAEFGEIDRFEIRCRLLHHVVPAPAALLITRVNPQAITDSKLPSHYEAMQEIARKLVSWSPSIFIGYNTLAFDELLLRQAFYQALLPIYLTNSNGNLRCDVLRLVQAVATLAPKSITIPVDRKGRRTLKLDALAPANGYVHRNAHDALEDVRATIFVARLIRDRAAEIWDTLIPLIDKTEVVNRLRSGDPHCLVKYLRGRPLLRTVVGCGGSLENPTLLSVFDLTYDPLQFVNDSVEELVEVMSESEKTIGVIFSNKMPILLPLKGETGCGTGRHLPLAELRERADLISSSHAFQERVSLAISRRFSSQKSSKVVEKRIYEAFPSRADERRMEQFHAAHWVGRAEISESFDDERFREIGRRLVFYGDPQALASEMRMHLRKWLSNRKSGHQNISTGRTIDDALREADILANTMPQRKVELAEIRRWLESLRGA